MAENVILASCGVLETLFGVLWTPGETLVVDEACYASGGGLMGHSGVLWTPGETLWTPNLAMHVVVA